MELSSVNCWCRLVVFTLIACTTFAQDTEIWTQRKLITTLINPHLAYVKAEGPQDTLHYLYSGENMLSILSLKTMTHGKIDINTTYSPPRIEVNPKESLLYAFGIVFNNLIEYDDLKDLASVTDYQPETWNNHSTSMAIVSTANNKVIFEKNVTNNTNGSITFSFQNFAKDSRQDILPHMKVISNSSLVDFVIDNVQPSFNKSRFALEISYLSHGKSRFSIQSEKSLDDEYTPGTFQVTNWVAVSNDQSFFQWKPVCYFDNLRTTQKSTYVKSYTMFKVNSSFPALNTSLAYSFFDTNGDYNMTTNLISFGRSEDKFYVRNKFTAWSATIGYGVPPSEAVSTMAIVIIAVGLGIPILLFAGGGIYLCVKRRRTGYQQVFGTISS